MVVPGSGGGTIISGRFIMLALLLTVLFINVVYQVILEPPTQIFDGSKSSSGSSSSSSSSSSSLRVTTAAKDNTTYTKPSTEQREAQEEKPKVVAPKEVEQMRKSSVSFPSDGLTHLWPFSWHPETAAATAVEIESLTATGGGHVIEANDNLAVVPLSPFHACDNRIQQLTCLQTILLEDYYDNNAQVQTTMKLPVPIRTNLVQAVCNDLPVASRAHVMVCLQTHNFLGVLVHDTTTTTTPNKKESDSITTQKIQFVYPAEAQPLVKSWNDDNNANNKSATTSSRPTFRLIPRKVVPMSNIYLPRAEKPDKDRAADNNAGNFLWQYAATRLVNPATTLLLSDDQIEHVHADAYIIATANVLNLEQDNLYTDMTGHWRARMRAWQVPVVVLGMGVQAHIVDVEDTSSLQLFDYQRELLHEIESWQRIPATGTRGELSTAACHNAGLMHCLPMGCPTLVLSRELDLGQTLHEKWKAVEAQSDKSKVRIAMALPALNRLKDADNWNLLLDLLMTLHQQHETAYFILQMPYDRVALKDYQRLHPEMTKTPLLKVFNNTEEWLDFMMGEVDVVVSTRIHGGMAGVSASIPSVVIPTDIRIQELVRAMHIPHLLLEDVSNIMKQDDTKSDMLGRVLGKARFGDLKTTFEDNRRAKLKAWGDILTEAGLEMDPSLKRIVAQSSH